MSITNEIVGLKYLFLFRLIPGVGRKLPRSLFEMTKFSDPKPLANKQTNKQTKIVCVGSTNLIIYVP